MSDVAADLWIVWLDAVADHLAECEALDPLAPAGELDDLDGARRISRMALRRLLARSFGRDPASQAFAYGAHGKPCITGLAGDFNLSHCVRPRESGEGSDAVALIGLGPVAAIGVDLEPMRSVRLDARRRSQIIEAGIAVAEGAPLNENGEAAAIQAWARLEAWGKASGLGIGRTLSHFGIWGRAGAGSVSNTVASDGSGPLIVHDVCAGPGLFAAVALPRGIARPELKVLPDDPVTLDAILGGCLDRQQFRR